MEMHVLRIDINLKEKKKYIIEIMEEKYMNKSKTTREKWARLSQVSLKAPNSELIFISFNNIIILFVF